MARALYRDADIYLLDDPLSAVDVKVSKHLFERSVDDNECITNDEGFFDCRSIKSYLKEKICILVTHQIQFLQDATRIIVLENVCLEMKYCNW
jgi:ATP-binding cassette subfamily C (CFTR/MRP) protein 4